MNKIGYEKKNGFHELDGFANDKELTEAMRACVKAQKEASAGRLGEVFKPNGQAVREVSSEALQDILTAGRDIDGIQKSRHISNVVIFSDPRFENSIRAEAVKKAREALDRIVRARLKDLFENARVLSFNNSGFFLYPPQGYMGWHTNAETPGWRFYATYVDEPGKSFIRYRDPQTGGIITSMDREFSFRLFKVSKDAPIWHAIYSDTHRFSFGYRIFRPGLWDRIRRLKRFLHA